jgi:hypothetical protein
MFLWTKLDKEKHVADEVQGLRGQYSISFLFIEYQ